jgi:hypothetical protein
VTPTRMVDCFVDFKIFLRVLQSLNYENLYWAQHDDNSILLENSIPHCMIGVTIKPIRLNEVITIKIINFTVIIYINLTF